MPHAQRRQPSSVIERLVEDPHRHEFFQAVRMLERWLADDESQGRSDAWARRLRFRNSLSQSFAPSQIAELKVVRRDGDAPNDPATRDPVGAPSADAVERLELTPAFMGLLGVQGALPMFYTDTLAHREAFLRDRAPRAFLDIFQHRAVALFYQAWRKHRLPLQYERDRRRHFLPQVLALAGLGQPALQGRLQARDGGVADDTLAHFAGALQQRPTSASTIVRVLQRYFDVPVRLESFVGRWFNLPTSSQTTLGLGQAVLGHSAVVGERVWQRDLRVRLTLGPMPADRFERFLPGGPGEKALRELLSLFTGVAFEYEVRLSLRAADVRAARLAEGDSPAGARLGWDAFLLSQPATEDRGEPGYDIHALA